ncbi:9889_t:CDS:2 [Racocetra persica]|uniref:9889_t:CDS:1 n=1 Tax=Racocetra persica TaxID=160502 RepID=A0ACA9NGL8_9GLOM|nr:9889_t:CDS:2 [Racocetra persica]
MYNKNNNLDDLKHDDRSTYNSVIAIQENEELSFSKKKLRKRVMFESWEEALDVIKIYAQQEEFKLRKGCSKKTSDRPTKDNPHSIIYITTLKNMHNHTLSPNREKFFNSIEFTQKIYKYIEFYINMIKLKLLQIKKALEKEFPNHKFYFSKVHKATAKFYCEKWKDISNDTAFLYEDLLRKKKEDPR